MTEPRLLERPAVFSAIVAASATIGVAVAGAIGGSISSYYQEQSSIAQLKANILLAIVQSNKPFTDELANRVHLLLQSGVLEDKDGTICRAFSWGGVSRECPVHVERSK